MMISRTSLTSNHYTPVGIRAVRLVEIIPLETEDRGGKKVYRRDIEFEVLKTPAY